MDTSNLAEKVATEREVHMNNNHLHMTEFEEILVEKFGEKANGLDDIPVIWRNYPLSWLCYGEREVCVRETSPMWVTMIPCLISSAYSIPITELL